MPMGTTGLGNAIDNVFLSSEGYFSIGTVLACFVIGYVIKHYTKIENHYIPLIMIALGIIINTLLNLPTDDMTQGVTISTVLVGGISGLASSGLYEFLAKSLGLKKDDKDNKDDNSNSNDGTGMG